MSKVWIEEDCREQDSFFGERRVMALYSAIPAPRAHGGASKSTRVALVAVMCACACLGMFITHYSAEQSTMLVEEADGLELNAYLSDSERKEFKKLIKMQVREYFQKFQSSITAQQNVWAACSLRTS